MRLAQNVQGDRCTNLISSELRTSAFGMSRLCPGVLGKASRMARLCSVSNILVDGMSPSRIFLKPETSTEHTRIGESCTASARLASQSPSMASLT